MRTLILPLLATVSFAAAAQPSTRPTIPIHAWVGVPQEHTSVERYKELAACGFTTSFSGFSDAARMRKALDAAHAAGIKLFLSHPQLHSDPEAAVKEFKDHPALAGYHLIDEPSAARFPELARWARRIQAVDNDHPVYINLFPTYATPDQLGAPTYEEHLRLFTEQVPVPFISFDHYPIHGDNQVRTDWYHNLELIRAASLKSKKPFWAFCLSVPHNPYPQPTISHLRLQAFTNLAYGAQCIQYFTYWTPESSTWNFHNAPIDPKGNRTPTYDLVKQANAEIQALAPVFAGATVLSVTHTGPKLPHGTRAYEPQAPFKSLATEGPGALISELANGGRRYLVVLNPDLKSPTTLRLTADPAAQVVRLDPTLRPQPLARDSHETDLAPATLAIFSWPRTP